VSSADRIDLTDPDLFSATIEAALAGRCAEILDAAVERGTCDFLVDVAAELPLQAIASLLGVPQDDRHLLLDRADATLDYDDHDPGRTSEKSQAAGAAMSAYSVRLLDEKRRCPADDILSIVATAELPESAEPAGPMTELEQHPIVDAYIDAINAGCRTSGRRRGRGLRREPLVGERRGPLPCE
jgi:cytochrome P450